MKLRGNFAVTPSDLHTYSQFNNELFCRQPHWQLKLSAMTPTSQNLAQKQMYLKMRLRIHKRFPTSLQTIFKDNPALRVCFQTVFEILLNYINSNYFANDCTHFLCHSLIVLKLKYVFPWGIWRRVTWRWASDVSTKHSGNIYKDPRKVLEKSGTNPAGTRCHILEEQGLQLRRCQSRNAHPEVGECIIRDRNQENATIGAWLCMVMKLGHFGQQIRNTWQVLKCVAGAGWRRSVGPIMWEMKKCYLESMSRGISCMK